MLAQDQARASNRFAEALESGRFLVTTEEPPPKGSDLSQFEARVEPLRGVVDAVNVTESSGAVMTMSPVGVAPSLIARGLEPILQMTCRDRNRIALQADLLAAAALGVKTVSCMTGDSVAGGDHAEATPVFDLDTISLIETVGELSAGRDAAGSRLKGAPTFLCGAMVNPGAPDLGFEIDRMEAKAAAGARFFQTQAVYEPRRFERFMARAAGVGVPVLAGFIVPKSAAMARRLNRTLPDVCVPEGLIAELEEADDRVGKSIEISGRILAEVKDACQGIHVIAVGWESKLPAILEAAGMGGRS
jgi:methylenetetrahydrofolate reductase (NADPH)